VSAGEGSRYDAYASWYHEWVAAPSDDFVATSLLRLIGSVRGERILDLGCGEGRVARVLAADDNDVVGVDLSDKLLAIARDHDSRRITYVHADVCTTEWWDGQPFDGVVSSMALMDIDDLEGALTTVAATLRPSGWFAWSIIHPGFPGVREIRSSWPTDGSSFSSRAGDAHDGRARRARGSARSPARVTRARRVGPGGVVVISVRPLTGLLHCADGGSVEGEWAATPIVNPSS
jgi:SAM-dependent methyltransferase